MKTWQRRTLRTTAAVVVLMLIAVALSWRQIRILVNAGALSGKKESIPSVLVKALPAVVKGNADWTCWRGRDGDGRSAVSGILEDWSEGLRQLWQIDFLCQDTSSASWSCPVIQGNHLIVCGRDEANDLIFCLDPADGTLLWRTSYETAASSGHGSGARATPCIDGDRVYTFGRSGDLACWRLLDGREVWRRNVSKDGGNEPRWGHSSSPYVVGDIVAVQAGGTARALAVDKNTGRVVWKSGHGPAGYAALTSMDLGGTPVILAFHGKGLAAHDVKSGNELWNTPWETAYDVNATTPIAAGGTVFITSGYGTGCALLKVSRAGAEMLWRNEVIASHHSDPYAIDGFLYGYSGQSTQNRGAFKCVDLKDGVEQWSTDELGWGTCTVVEGYLLCGDIRGNIFLVKPDPERFIQVTNMAKALGDIKAGPAWTAPVAANGRLYLRCKQRLVCYDLLSR